MWGMEKASVQEKKIQNQQLEQDIKSFSHKIESFLIQVNELILDKPQQTKLALTCLLAGGHVLFEDLPGLGKTTLASALARLAGLHFQRIQFTNDMLASDVIGINIFNQKEHVFEFKKGPVFTQILLADEINRCSPKTQSALLEAMEEGAVTVDGIHYELPQPFWVLATQNPLFQSGTYALPESQLDRFLMRLSLGYPSRQAEKLLLQQSSRQLLIHQLDSVFNQADILHLRELAKQVFLSDAVLNYILDLAAETRKQRHGLSTRGVLALKAASQAYALVEGRAFVTTDDVQMVFISVVSHRLSLGENEVRKILESVEAF
ncbi:AAA family ATPase [Acinetobacter junii]|uniref:AAA family ATPase n=1 Tax=Acinetobacter junii TaxID=40215 RepID=UPI00057A2F05|nr:MoxR family ATPase [Acinetobacter junii]APU48389.1 AAA family ATPase [Acinetobacter junii]MCU4407737.1 AAA family ATPase [Acinetobacter junii]MEB8380792.1 AAA family ATPase [Acinetobacter junii]TID70177.1 MoxR family ATPase [Acinetobacter junii]VTX68001.1 Holliday junction ATP-dependent DNA helicase RuvB [Acinetobacter junii]